MVCKHCGLPVKNFGTGINEFWLHPVGATNWRMCNNAMADSIVNDGKLSHYAEPYDSVEYFNELIDQYYEDRG